MNIEDFLKTTTDYLEDVPITFNLFQILKIENAEDKTHSAFLGELLNPKGSHLKGDLFLNLFLSGIGVQDFITKTRSPSVILEKHIGKVDLEKKTGGRVDIYIENEKGQIICLENKIHSGLGRYQLQRYLNHKKEINHVILLTLIHDPQINYEIESDDFQRFQHITYQSEIINFLKSSLNYITDDLGLTTVIEQYINILQILTSRNMNQDLKKHIIENIQEAKTIAANYDRVLSDIKIKFQKDVFDKLTKEVPSTNWVVVLGNKADSTNAQIWIKPKGLESLELCFGIETFSGRGAFAKKLIIGVFSSTKIPLEIEDSESSDKLWQDIKTLYDHEGTQLNFSDENFVVRLEKDENYRNKLIDQIISQSIEYFEDYESIIMRKFNELFKDKKEQMSV